MDDTARASMVPQAAARDVGGALVVDLDGSLIRTDTTVENLLALAKRPVLLSRALLAWRHGRARLKQELAAAVEFDPAALPYNEELLAYLREQHAAGRVLVLATGADRSTAEAVARHLGLFDLVLASDGQVNLTGRAKLAAIRDSRRRRAVHLCRQQPHRSAGMGATPPARSASTCRRGWPAPPHGRRRSSAPSVSESGRARTLLRALRPHQWATLPIIQLMGVASRVGACVGAGSLCLRSCCSGHRPKRVASACRAGSSRSCGARPPISTGTRPR